LYWDNITQTGNMLCLTSGLAMLQMQKRQNAAGLFVRQVSKKEMKPLKFRV